MNEKSLSTYDEFIQNPEQKKLFETEYQELILSELFFALMDEDSVSDRETFEKGCARVRAQPWRFIECLLR